MRLNLGSGGHPLDGFVNLDAITGWYFEDGLNFPDESVEAITISHALMYVAIKDWPPVFSELARVLQPVGMIRITEDSTANPDSERYGGHHDAVSLTTPQRVIGHLTDVGLHAMEVAPTVTLYRDDSLIQRWHGDPPKVFHVEGVK